MRIELRGKSFAGRAVLGPIQLTIGRGRRVAVLGPSGIGKSTLLRIVAGLDRDFDGQAEGTKRALRTALRHFDRFRAAHSERHPFFVMPRWTDDPAAALFNEYTMMLFAMFLVNQPGARGRRAGVRGGGTRACIRLYREIQGALGAKPGSGFGV